MPYINASWLPGKPKVRTKIVRSHIGYLGLLTAACYKIKQPTVHDFRSTSIVPQEALDFSWVF